MATTSRPCTEGLGRCQGRPGRGAVWGWRRKAPAAACYCCCWAWLCSPSHRLLPPSHHLLPSALATLPPRCLSLLPRHTPGEGWCLPATIGPAGPCLGSSPTPPPTPAWAHLPQASPACHRQTLLPLGPSPHRSLLCGVLRGDGGSPAPATCRVSEPLAGGHVKVLLHLLVFGSFLEDADTAAACGLFCCACGMGDPHSSALRQVMCTHFPRPS